MFYEHLVYVSSFSYCLVYDKSTKISNFLECHLKTDANKYSKTAYNICLYPGDTSKKAKHQYFFSFSLLKMSQCSTSRPYPLFKQRIYSLEGRCFLFFISLSFFLFLSNAERHWSSADSFRGKNLIAHASGDVQGFTGNKWSRYMQGHKMKELCIFFCFCLFALFGLLLMRIPAMPWMATTYGTVVINALPWQAAHLANADSIFAYSVLIQCIFQTIVHYTGD